MQKGGFLQVFGLLKGLIHMHNLKNIANLLSMLDCFLFTFSRQSNIPSNLPERSNNNPLLVSYIQQEYPKVSPNLYKKGQFHEP
jgi:hypothetical protein